MQLARAHFFCFCISASRFSATQGIGSISASMKLYGSEKLGKGSENMAGDKILYHYMLASACTTLYCNVFGYSRVRFGDRVYGRDRTIREEVCMFL